MTTIPELTNEVILGVLQEIEDNGNYISYPEADVLLDLRCQQDRPWLLVERKPGEREVYLSMHRSLDAVEWAIQEAMWDTEWRPVAIYDTENGTRHEIYLSIQFEGME